MNAPLPRVADYLQSVWDLGRRSFRPALPALAFLYFYRVGVGAYMAVSDRTFVAGSATMGDMLPRIAMLASVLPLFLLVYTPMLPLQDALLRNAPIPFLAAVRRVLETAWALTISGIVQAFMLFVPLFILCVAAAVAMPLLGPMEAVPNLQSGQLMLVLGAAVFGLLGMLVVGTLIAFATPAVVLDDEGPIRSIGTSIRLVMGRLGAVLSRLFAFFFLSFVVLIVVTMPTQILDQMTRISGGPIAAVKIASVIWSSAVATVFFPFGVASLTVLYRALVPFPGDARGAAPVLLEDEIRPAARNAPFE